MNVNALKIYLLTKPELNHVHANASKLSETTTPTYSSLISLRINSFLLS